MNRKQRLVPMLVVFFSLAPTSTWAGPPMVPVRIHVDSQADGDPAAKALDGDPGTFWHTRYGDGETRPPHEITVDLSAQRRDGDPEES